MLVPAPAPCALCASTCHAVPFVPAAGMAVYDCTDCQRSLTVLGAIYHMGSSPEADRPSTLTPQRQRNRLPACRPPAQALLHMLGYKARQMKEMNISALMPSPFSTHHSAYIDSYIESGTGSHFCFY
jgi:hypothetical protein